MSKNPLRREAYAIRLPSGLMAGSISSQGWSVRRGNCKSCGWDAKRGRESGPRGLFRPKHPGSRDQTDERQNEQPAVIEPGFVIDRMSHWRKKDEIRRASEEIKNTNIATILASRWRQRVNKCAKWS